MRITLCVDWWRFAIAGILLGLIVSEAAWLHPLESFLFGR